MSYTALYRKFRPSVFEEVKGQDHIVTTLKNQIVSNRIGHAYLFCGTRGTGKTTIAKIFAKAVNCQNPVDGSPCGCCTSCQEITNGNSMNVMEIDAASNNSVENIRNIIEEVSYAPTDAKYKVYIIDEVHMLSLGAFNALLKTLEEPPSYVVFILATTESHKIPVTIHSRCQEYDFKRISIETIADRLKELTEIEGMKVEDRALRYIAKMGDGSMRDALSLLDQCIAFHYGEELTYDMALDVLGAVDTEVFSRLFRTVVADDIIGCITLLEEIVMQGRELTQFVTDFTWFLRNLMLLKSSKDEHVEDVLDVSTEHLKQLREDAASVELNTILRYINIFSELSGRMKYASQKRILLEMTIIKLCCPEMETDNSSVLERVRKVEKKIENGLVMAAPGTGNGQNNLYQPENGAEPKKLPAAVPEDLQKIVREWPQIVGMTDGLLKPVLSKAKLSMGDNDTLFLCVSNKVQAGQLEEKSDEIKILLANHVGKEVNFAIRMYSEEQGFDMQYPDLRQLINTNIEEE